MMKFRLIVLLLVFLGLYQVSCDQKPEVRHAATRDAEMVASSIEDEGRGLLNKCLEAHGGIDLWNQFEGLEYTLINNGKPVYQLTQLKDRRAYIKSEEYEVGFDGEVAWVYPDATNISGNSPAFYYNLDFYFIAMPFVLADPGVIVAHEGSAQIGGTPYEVLRVSFRSDVGFTPEDIYLLYLDATSFRLEVLVYSISFFEKEETGLLKTAKVYSDYSEVQGLLMPGKMENFSWDNGELGESKDHVRLFQNIRFLNEIPDPNLFSVRQGAITEKMSK